MGKKKEKILVIGGFDLGADFGYSILDMSGSRIDSGVLKLGKRSPKSADKLYKALDAIFSSYSFSLVSYEKVNAPHIGKAAAHAYGGYEFMLFLFCGKYKITEIVPLAVSTVKKVATGNYRATKEEMVESANNSWSVVLKDHNECDALWVAETARRKLLS